MQVDKATLAAWFTLFNHKYFDDELPVPALATGKSRTRLGSLTWKYRRKIFSKQPYDYVIRISNYYDLDETGFKSVLLHEMIHLHIVSKKLKDTSPHGIIFRNEMRRINADGWRISVSAKVDGTKKAGQPHTKKRRRIILAVLTAEGKHMLSVVNPAYVKSIDLAISHSQTVQSYSWFVSNDDYFAAFPTVRTPKGRIVAAETFMKMTESMQVIKP